MKFHERAVKRWVGQKGKMVEVKLKWSLKYSKDNLALPLTDVTLEI
jgi:hypothetical protein